MFKQGSFEDEIFRSMETSLVKNQTENKHGFNKLAKAADLLNEAAAIFDNAGMYQESKEITTILKSMAEEQINGLQSFAQDPRVAFDQLSKDCLAKINMAKTLGAASGSKDILNWLSQQQNSVYQYMDLAKSDDSVLDEAVAKLLAIQKNLNLLIQRGGQ